MINCLSHPPYTHTHTHTHTHTPHSLHTGTPATGIPLVSLPVLATVASIVVILIVVVVMVVIGASCYFCGGKKVRCTLCAYSYTCKPESTCIILYTVAANKKLMFRSVTTIILPFYAIVSHRSCARAYRFDVCVYAFNW